MLFFQSNEVTVSGSTSWAQRPGIYGVAEGDIRIVPKLDSSNVPEKMSRVMDRNGGMTEENSIAGNRDNEIMTNDDGEVKQRADLTPNRFEAMKAVRQLMLFEIFSCEIVSVYLFVVVSFRILSIIFQLIKYLIYFREIEFQIATLLKIPGVQQVAVVQNNDKIPDNMIMRPEIVPDS